MVPDSSPRRWSFLWQAGPRAAASMGGLAGGSLRSILTYVGSNLFVRATSLLVTPIIFRSFSVEDVGVFFLCSSLLGYGVLVLNSGFNQPLLRMVASGDVPLDAGRLLAYRYLSAALAYAGLLGLTASWPLLRAHWELAVVMFASIIPACVSMDWALMGAGRYANLNALQVLSQLLYVGCVALVSYHHSLFGLGLAQVGLSLALAAGSLLVLYRTEAGTVRRIVESARAAVEAPLRFAWEGIAKYWGFTLVIAFTVIFNGLDITLSGLLLGGTELGVVAALSRMSGICITLVAVLNEILFALSARKRASVAAIRVMSVGLAAALIVGFQATAQAAVALLFGPSFVAYTPLFRLSVLGVLPASAFYACMTELLSKMDLEAFRRRALARILGVSALSIISVGVPLVHAMGLPGVAVFGIAKWSLMATAIYMAVRGSAVSTVRPAEVQLNDA